MVSSTFYSSFIHRILLFHLNTGMWYPVSIFYNLLLLFEPFPLLARFLDRLHTFDIHPRKGYSSLLLHRVHNLGLFLYTLPTSADLFHPSLLMQYIHTMHVVIAAPTNYDSKKNYFDTSAVEAVIELVLKVNPEAIMVIKAEYTVCNKIFPCTVTFHNRRHHILRHIIVVCQKLFGIFR